MSDRTPTEINERINKFFGKDFVNAEASCPLCGASIKWNWTSTENMAIHIDWHEKWLFWETVND